MSVLYFCDGSKDLCIKRCHLNLWLLPSLSPFEQYALVLDIGLHLHGACFDQPGSESNRAIAESDKTFTLVCPVSTDTDVAKDLHQMEEQERYMIFGRAASEKPNHVEYEGRSIPIVPLKGKPQYLDQESRGTLSAWKVTVSARQFSQTSDGHVYVRFRLLVDRPYPLVVWQRAGLLRYLVGAVVDLRVNDVRGVSLPSGGFCHPVESWMAIEDLRFFAIVPLQLIPEITSPELRYGRLFEGKVWHRYLGRATHIVGLSRYVVYQWPRLPAPTSANVVNAESPFRVFVEFRRNSAALLAAAVFRTGLVQVVVCLATLIWIFNPVAVNPLNVAVQTWIALGSVGLIGVLTRMVLVFGDKAPRAIRQACRRWSYRVYRLFVRDL